MNRTLYDTSQIGGYTFEIDDLEFDQLAVHRAFFGWLSGLGVGLDKSFIISGCTVVVNGANLDISAGFLAFNGEILEVDAHSIVDPTIGGDQTFWERVTTFDPAGDEIFDDTSSHQTYEINRGKLTSDAAPPVTFFDFNRTTLTSLTLDKILRDKILERRNIFTKPQSWGTGSQTNNNAGDVALALDGSNYETIINNAVTNSMQLIDEGALVTLHTEVGTQFANTFVAFAGAPPAGFGEFVLGAALSLFTISGDSITFQQRSGRWVLYGGSYTGTALFLKKNTNAFSRTIAEDVLGANLINNQENLITSGIGAFVGTSLKMRHELNVELITGGSAVSFSIRLYVDGNLQKTKVHEQASNIKNVVHIMHVQAYTPTNTVVEWRIQPAGANSQFKEAIAINDAVDLVV